MGEQNFKCFGGPIKWAVFTLPWCNSSDHVRSAPGTGHTWLSPYDSILPLNCKELLPSGSGSAVRAGGAGSATLVCRVGGANV